MTTTEAVAETTTEATAAVAMLPQRIVEAWSRADGAAFADVFVEDGIMIIAGVHLSGNDAIAEFMTQAFAGPYRGTRVTGTPIDLRVIAPGVVLLVTSGGVIQAGRSEVADTDAIRATWLAVQRDGDWKLAAYQNSPRD